MGENMNIRRSDSTVTSFLVGVASCLSWLFTSSVVISVANLRAQSDAGSADSYLRRGDAWYERGGWDRAIGDYDRGFALGSVRSGSSNNRGNARQATGRPERAKLVESRDH